MKRFIYADNSATTNLDAAVLEQMMPYLTTEYGNASSLYSFAAGAKEAIEKARDQVAVAIGALPREIYFTAGGSESDNWAIKGIAKRMLKNGKNHIISTKFEHHAVLHTLDALKKEGFEVTLLEVHSDGLVRVDELKAAIKETTGLVTVMYANNEIGTIQPVAEIGKICREKGVVFHTDAVQAVGNVAIDVEAQCIDMLSMSGHKFHGPKGVGALYIRRGVLPLNLIDGGAQENGRRAGTENTAGIVGIGAAIEKAVATMDARNEKCQKIRDYIMDECLKIERSRVNGDRVNRLPGNVNMCFEGVEGESLLLMLDAKGICASSGSACTSGSLDPSHVLLSIGLKHEVAHGSLRLSFSDDNTMEDAEYICSVLPPIIERLRAMSPLWDRIKAEEKEN
ncbi:MAG: cysteine desulfurase NifS [Acutalibacteraceae bacterium]|nr:cysteine desulfurase NifS [Acutalibacteraceae bacterium]